MTVDLEQFHQVFFEESFEGLDAMESGLLGLDLGAADVEEINTIFRAAHSIKGGAGTFGFTDISAFTHVMETLLDENRDGRRTVTREEVDILLRSVDCLRDMMTATRDGEPVDEASVASHKVELEAMLAGEAVASGVAEVSAAPVQAEVSPVADGEVGWHIVFAPREQLLRRGNDVVGLLRELGELGDITVRVDTDQVPTFAELDPEVCYLSWDIVLLGAAPREAVDDIFSWVEDDADMAIMALNEVAESSSAGLAMAPVAASAPVSASVPAPALKVVADGMAAPAATPKAKSPPKATANSGSIRVGIDKIDELINMVGELVITQSMLGMLGESFDMHKLERLQDGLGQLERHTRELQESVMQIRMLPISFTFSRFPRLVRDLSGKMGKKIELVLSGEHTEVDKTVIEKIGDPLVHLVRNSLDHGIEMPEARVAAGKPETGTIKLSAYHKGGNIVIEIRDDGRGLSADILLEKARSKGLVAEEANFTTKQIYEFIFLPGFSTAEQVSDVSGRGVGMDVVRKNIQALGGDIEIQSEPGQGTTFIIRLPLTLAILDGQSVSVGGETFIIPLVSIIESIQSLPGAINRVSGSSEVFQLRDEYLPIIRLGELLGVRPGERLANPIAGDGLLVVVEGDGRKCGLLIDDLLGQQQVVIKSMEANYRRVEGFSGATILGDGSVALILDIPGLIRLAGAPVVEPQRLSACIEESCHG